MPLTCSVRTESAAPKHWRKKETKMGRKRLLFADKARQNLLAGIEVLARTVGPTLGPIGGNVAVDGRSRGGTIRYDPPQIIAQGQHIVRDLEVQDHFQNLGVKLLRQAAQKTD